MFRWFGLSFILGGNGGDRVKLGTLLAVGESCSCGGHQTDLVSCCRRWCSRLINTRLNSEASSLSFSESVSLATCAATNSQSAFSFGAISKLHSDYQYLTFGGGTCSEHNCSVSGFDQ